jgi:hypothetical protein
MSASLTVVAMVVLALGGTGCSDGAELRTGTTGSTISSTAGTTGTTGGTTDIVGNTGGGGATSTTGGDFGGTGGENAMVASGGTAGIVGGTTSYVGLTGTDGGSTSTIGGTGGGDAAANCTNERPDAGANSCSATLPLPCKPCIACAPASSGGTGVCAAPDIAMFDWLGGGVDTSLRYPVGCAVYLPTQNPYYPGGPQICYCNQAGEWVCPT